MVQIRDGSVELTVSAPSKRSKHGKAGVEKMQLTSDDVNSRLSDRLPLGDQSVNYSTQHETRKARLHRVRSGLVYSVNDKVVVRLIPMGVNPAEFESSSGIRSLMGVG